MLSLFTFGVGNVLVVGIALCFIGCLAASIVPTHWMPRVCLHTQVCTFGQSKMSLDNAKCSFCGKKKNTPGGEPLIQRDGPENLLFSFIHDEVWNCMIQIISRVTIPTPWRATSFSFLLFSNKIMCAQRDKGRKVCACVGVRGVSPIFCKYLSVSLSPKYYPVAADDLAYK